MEKEWKGERGWGSGGLKVSVELIFTSRERTKIILWVTKASFHPRRIFSRFITFSPCLESTGVFSSCWLRLFGDTPIRDTAVTKDPTNARTKSSRPGERRRGARGRKSPENEENTFGNKNSLRTHTILLHFLCLYSQIKKTNTEDHTLTTELCVRERVERELREISKLLSPIKKKYL